MLPPRYGFLLLVGRRRRQCHTLGHGKNSPFTKVRRVLRTAFGKYLLFTNTISAGALMFVGDLVQQQLEYQEKLLPQRYDYGRLCRMSTVALGQGVLQHYYYTWLTRAMPARCLQIVVVKILLDQCVMAPLYIATFFYGIGIMEGKSLFECAIELKRKFWEIYRVDCFVWPPVQFINFYLVPNRFQVIYINSITLVYNVFLSCVKHKESSSEAIRGSAICDKYEFAT